MHAVNTVKSTLTCMVVAMATSSVAGVGSVPTLIVPGGLMGSEAGRTSSRPRVLPGERAAMIAAARAQKIRSLRGKYRDRLSPSDELLRERHEGLDY